MELLNECSPLLYRILLALSLLLVVWRGKAYVAAIKKKKAERQELKNQNIAIKNTIELLNSEKGS